MGRMTTGAGKTPASTSSYQRLRESSHNSAISENGGEAAFAPRNFRRARQCCAWQSSGHPRKAGCTKLPSPPAHDRHARQGVRRRGWKRRRHFRYTTIYARGAIGTNSLQQSPSRAAARWRIRPFMAAYTPIPPIGEEEAESNDFAMRAAAAPLSGAENAAGEQPDHRRRRSVFLSLATGTPTGAKSAGHGYRNCQHSFPRRPTMRAAPPSSRPIAPCPRR